LYQSIVIVVPVQPRELVVKNLPGAGVKKDTVTLRCFLRNIKGTAGKPFPETYGRVSIIFFANNKFGKKFQEWHKSAL
jgi:hypothetical protein